MGKKVRKRWSEKENYSPSSKEKIIPLDSTDDTDIIECSILNENKYDFRGTAKRKSNCRKVNETESPKTPVQTKELKNSSGCNSDELRLSLRKSYGLSEPREKAEFSLEILPRKNSEESNSVIKKLISSLKKTPDPPCLSKTKLRNIEQWLKENEVEVVKTPPFANLSVTPVNSISKRLSSRWKNSKPKQEHDSSIDSEVEGVLKAVYGNDWKRKNVQNHAKTEPKKKPVKFFSPVSLTKRKEFHSVRRNILRGKRLNLNEDEEDDNLEDSIVSGVQVINLDSSGYSDEQTKANILKTLRKKSKIEAANNSLDSIVPSPQRKKEVENKKSSTNKKLCSKVTPKTPRKTFLASLSVSTPTSRCHPDAQHYKINFKTKKEELVKKLYKLYNIEVFEGKLSEDMSFSWNVKLRGTAGYCYNKRVTKSSGKVTRLSRIEFSTKIVDRADRLRDTMIHELCHAASWVIDGVLDGHGEVWTKWACLAMNRFPELPPIKRCHNYDIVSKYVYRCTVCGYCIKRHSKSINTEKKRCGHCYGILELLINKKKKGKGEVPEFNTTRTLPTPNKFAVFVKENYHLVKSTKANAKHSEVMKVLSEQYALLKNGSK